MPAKANLFSSDVHFLFQASKAVVFKVGVILHEVFDVIEVLVYLVEAVES